MIVIFIFVICEWWRVNNLPCELLVNRNPHILIVHCKQFLTSSALTLDCY